MTEDKQKELEGEKILASTERNDFVVLLDERGRELTSREFATFIDKKAVTLPRNLVFVIGGPYGFSKSVYDRADSKLSLSKMTFPHELVRLFFVEQLYRACTINRGEPYHHD
jgi:23S rRNA (pseudouridine1915-N3)-methyltransferase